MYLSRNNQNKQAKQSKNACCFPSLPPLWFSCLFVWIAPATRTKGCLMQRPRTKIPCSQIEPLLHVSCCCCCRCLRKWDRQGSRQTHTHTHRHRDTDTHTHTPPRHYFPKLPNGRYLCGSRARPWKGAWVLRCKIPRIRVRQGARRKRCLRRRPSPHQGQQARSDRSQQHKHTEQTKQTK